MAARKRSESMSEAGDSTTNVNKNGILRPGAKVWVGPTESAGVYNAYSISQVNDEDGTVEVFRSLKDPVETVRMEHCYVINPKAVADLCGLHNIHEPGILANLEERMNWPELSEGGTGGGGLRSRNSLRGKAAGDADPLAYTYLSTVLVAVNPLRALPNPPKFTDYLDKSFNPETPHPYAIAELAFQNCRVPRESEPASQSIVISGESGAGKTETAKIILSYLSNRGSSSSGASASTGRIAQCILDSSPVFEAFGNAKTTRNNNSSRFGKFISMYFAPDQEYSLVGASVTTYLLEKMRVCLHSEGERNFHIFYDVLGNDGKSKLMKSHKLLGLAGIQASQLNYLSDVVPQRSSNRKKSRAADDKDDAEGAPPDSGSELLGCGNPEVLSKVLRSLEVIGVVADRRLEIFRVLSGILHLGNAAVTEKDTVEGLKAHIADDDAKSGGGLGGKLSSLGCIGKAAELFGLDGPDSGRAALVELLTVKKIKVMREKNLTSIKLLGEEAQFRRDAVSRALYAGIFAWLVDISNQHLEVTEADANVADRPFIGVLDIFGFESFPVNGLEQVLINFANEYLQNIFNKQVFEAELRLFEEENMRIQLDECPDNQPCVNLLSESKVGILDMLNEQCAQIKPSEEKFVRDVTDRHKASKFFPKVHRKDQRDHFQVQHFAGVVQYRVEGWLLKNSDPIPEALAATFTAGKKALGVTKDVFGSKNLLLSGSGDGGGGKNKKPTVCSSFMTSMKALKVQLETTKCNFIRCIKPNPLMKYGIFDRSYVIEQLRCLGILTTCEVLKAGMPTRITYKELKGTALAGLPEDTAKLFDGQPEEVLIAACMTAFDVPAAAYQLGRTRVFFKAGEIGRVETILKSGMTPEINERMILALKRRAKALEAAEGVQKLQVRVEAPNGELWVRANDAVKAVEAASEKTAGDFEESSEAISSCQFKKGQAAAALDDATSDFDELKADSNLKRLAGEQEVVTRLAKAQKALEMAQAAHAGSDGRGVASYDLAGTKKKYGELIDACSADTADARRTTRDMHRTMDRVVVLCKEAADGAARCLLEYTIERTEQAEKDAADLDTGIAVFEAKAKEIELTNAALKEEAIVSVAAVEKLVAEDITVGVDIVNAELAEVRTLVQKAVEIAVGNAAATKLQARARIFLARVLVSKMRQAAKELASIVTMQCGVRCWMARQTVDVMRLEKEEADRAAAEVLKIAQGKAIVRLQTRFRIRKSQKELWGRRQARADAIAKAEAEAEAARLAAEAKAKAEADAAAAGVVAAAAKRKAEEAAAAAAAAADAGAKAKAEQQAREAKEASENAAADAAAAEEARKKQAKEAEEAARLKAQAEKEAAEAEAAVAEAAKTLALEATKALAADHMKVDLEEPDERDEDAAAESYDPHRRPRQTTVDAVVSGPASTNELEKAATITEEDETAGNVPASSESNKKSPAASSPSGSGDPKKAPSAKEKTVLKSTSTKAAAVHEVPDDIIVLKERLGYEPTDEEILNYAEWLGLKEGEEHLTWIPRKAMRSPLPKPWKPCKARDTGDVFYFNPTTGESLWHHPQDDHWANLFAQYQAREGKLYERNEELVHQLRQPIAGPTEGVFTISLAKPMGLGLGSNAIVDNVKPGGQGEKAGIRSGSQILSIGGKDVSTLRSIKVAIKRCRDKGDETIEVEFMSPVPTAVTCAEDEFLVADDELDSARDRLEHFGGPDGPFEEDVQILLMVRIVHVFRIPQDANARCSDWGRKAVWAGKLTIVQREDKCTIQLLDSSSGTEFAQSPVTNGAVLPTEDAENAFALRCVNKGTGQKAYVGLKFSNDDDESFVEALQNFAEYNKKKRETKGSLKSNSGNPKTFFGPDEDFGNDGDRESSEDVDGDWVGLYADRDDDEDSDDGAAADDNEDSDDEDAPRFGGGFAAAAGDEEEDSNFYVCEQCGERVPVNNVRPHVCITLSDNLSNEVKLMKVRGQRHGASLPRGHEEVKSSMHANIDGFRKEMQVGVEVVKLNKKDMKTGSRVISLTGENLTELVCKNKKKLMGFSKESYDLTQLLHVQLGESPDANGGTKWDMGTSTLRQHCLKNELVKQMQTGGQCFSLIFPERSIDLAAQSKAQRDFLAGGFELMVGKGDDFGKLIKISLTGRGTMGIGFHNDWAKGSLLVTRVDPGSEADEADLKAGDNIVDVNGDTSWATKDSSEAETALVELKRPVIIHVERTQNLDHKEEIHRTVQREKVLREFLSSAGLAKFEEHLLKFGVESVDDLTNYRIVNDDVLMSEDIGMSKEQVRLLRQALEKHIFG